MITLKMLLMILALILLLLATFNVPARNVNLVAAGLFLLVLAQLVTV